jgi:hypothetical protein
MNPNLKGIRLDLGCGGTKQKGFLGMDKRKLKGVDIVHDLEEFPYPLENESCRTIVAAHVVEHIKPWKMIDFMNELWRIMEVDGQLAIAYPYGVNLHFQKDPSHCNVCNQATWTYFDPGYNLYDVYKPLPWKVENNLWQETGQGEVLLKKISIKDGKLRRKEAKHSDKLQIKGRIAAEKKIEKERKKARRVDNFIKNSVEQSLASTDEKELKSGIINNREKPIHRLIYGCPMTGIVRGEWAITRFNQVVPCNWSKVDMTQWLDQWSPLGFTVADARNIIATVAVEQEFEWLFFHDHDVIIPQGTLLWLNELMIKRDTPVVSGIYFTKSVPSEPLIYMKKGEGYAQDWKFGDKKWVGFTHMGCTLIHVSILKAMYTESPSYQMGNSIVKRIFETPAKVWYDYNTDAFHAMAGTEDIHWCDKVVTGGFFEKAGWPEFQKKQYPFLCDTSIYCKHISFDGVQYPMNGEDLQFEPHRLKNVLSVKNDSKDTMK